MNSTLTLDTRTATGVAAPTAGPAVLGCVPGTVLGTARDAVLGTAYDAVLLPAATAAPAALVIAVDAPVSQETSVRMPDAVDAAALVSDAAAFRTAAFAGAAKNRTHVQGPPPRGTPV